MTALTLTANGWVLSGTHPSTGRPVSIPVRVKVGTAVPLKGDLFAVAGLLGAEVPGR